MSNEVRIDAEGMRWLTSRAGPGAAMTWREGVDVMAGAKDSAPYDTGNLVAHIQAEDGEDQRGYYVDVVTAATNDDGYAYGTRQEILRPYLEPALEEEIE